MERTQAIKEWAYSISTKRKLSMAYEFYLYQIAVAAIFVFVECAPITRFCCISRFQSASRQ